jgi:hypothetical protein
MICFAENLVGIAPRSTCRKALRPVSYFETEKDLFYFIWLADPDFAPRIRVRVCT